MQASKSLGNLRKPVRQKASWFEKLAALLALANLLLVLFDLSYVAWRNFYLQELPMLTRLYDPIKGIEPHRDTQRYLDTVTQLETQLAQTGLESEAVNRLLDDLRQQSVVMVEENPFELANKTGTLEKIKNRLRRHEGQESSKAAFQQFWSIASLTSATWQQELAFFNQDIRPLIATNYFRPYAETGGFVDRFWRIDIFFMAFFGLEFLARTYTLSRRHSGVTWFDAMLWRWYDVFLLLPVWRWLRVIPVTLRLHQSGLLNLHRVQRHVNHGLATNLAEEMTELIVIQLLNQAQNSVKRGDLLRLLLQPRRNIDINNINELEAIATHLLQLLVYEVLPNVQPEIEAVIGHSVDQALHQLPFHQQWQALPAVTQLSQTLRVQLAHNLSSLAYQTLGSALEDTQGRALVNQLTQRVAEVFQTKFAQPENQQHLQALLLDLLEELKLTYLQRSTSDALDQTLAEVEQRRPVPAISTPLP